MAMAKNDESVPTQQRESNRRAAQATVAQQVRSLMENDDVRLRRNKSSDRSDEIAFTATKWAPRVADDTADTPDRKAADGPSLAVEKMELGARLKGGEFCLRRPELVMIACDPSRPRELIAERPPKRPNVAAPAAPIQLRTRVHVSGQNHADGIRAGQPFFDGGK